MKDDRKEFAEFQRKKSLAIGEDPEIFEKSKRLMVELNEFSYGYVWTWMGLPIIQMPADIMATQEVIWKSKPDVIIETGVARGGSAVFMATLLEAMGNGIVIGVDIDIRAHNREAIENHPMAHRIKLVEGSSVAPETLQEVKQLVPRDARVIVVLDSDHSRNHVAAECRAYAPFVREGGYLVVADTIVGHLAENEAPKNRSKHWSRGNEPLYPGTRRHDARARYSCKGGRARTDGRRPRTPPQPARNPLRRLHRRRRTRDQAAVRPAA